MILVRNDNGIDVFYHFWLECQNDSKIIIKSHFSIISNSFVMSFWRYRDLFYWTLNRKLEIKIEIRLEINQSKQVTKFEIDFFLLLG